MSICSDNIIALTALRQMIANMRHDLVNQMNCGMVTETQLERQKYIETMQKILHDFVCDHEKVSYVKFKLETGVSSTSIFKHLRFHDENGNVLSGNAVSGINRGDLVIRSFDPFNLFTEYTSLPDGSIGNNFENYWKVLDDGTYNPYYRGYRTLGDGTVYFYAPADFKGFLSFGTWSGATSGTEDADNFVTITFDPNANFQEGCCFGDFALGRCANIEDDLRIVAQWLTEAAISGCGEAQALHYVGPCPPSNSIDCDALNSDMLLETYFDENFAVDFIPDPSTVSTAADWHHVNLNLDPSVEAIAQLNHNQYISMYITESTTGDIYRLDYDPTNTDATYTGKYSVAAVKPFGDDLYVDAELIQVDKDATYTLTLNLEVVTKYGGVCVLNYAREVKGEYFVPGTPDPMTLSGIEFEEENSRFLIEYSSSIIPQSGTIVRMYRDGTEIYQWVIGTNPNALFDGIEAQLIWPSTLNPLTAGTYSISWPAGWVTNADGSLAAAVNVGTYTWVVAAASTGFPYTLPATLS